MLSMLEGRASDRKLRLFVVACCHRLNHVGRDAWLARAVATTEALADGNAPPLEVAATLADAESVLVAAGGIATPIEAIVFTLLLTPLRYVKPYSVLDAKRVVTATSDAVGYEAIAGRGPDLEERDLSPFVPAKELEQAYQAILVREVFGNPFRPVTFTSEWGNDSALALAAQMYESRDFGAMPILADALQDAGCDDEDVLNHCRGHGPHVRGCWVVDLLLGKS
ncbi:hypothetical protein VT84_33805 [Gemmata sp. SH-PL17]|nr:hypothetical protein VT84_33805 [Gemmata sp. SH-PL17]